MDKNTIMKIMAGSQILLVIALFLCMKSCDNAKMRAENTQLLVDGYLEEQQKFDLEIDKLGKQIAEQEEVIIGKDRSLERKILENSNLKKLNSQIKVNFQTELKNVIAKYETIPGQDIFVHTTDTTHDTVLVQVPIGVKFGTRFSTFDDWYHYSGSVTRNGLLMDSLNFTNKLTITVGKRREKWNKPLKSFVEVQSDNPYTNITGLNNVKVINKSDKVWNKPWFNFLMGTATGTVLTTFLIYGSN